MSSMSTSAALSDGEVHRGLLGLVELRNVVDAAILKLDRGVDEPGDLG